MTQAPRGNSFSSREGPPSPQGSLPRGPFTRDQVLGPFVVGSCPASSMGTEKWCLFFSPKSARKKSRVRSPSVSRCR